MQGKLTATGETVEILNVERGWTTYKDSTGVDAKVRNSGIVLLDGEGAVQNPEAHGGKAPKAKKPGKKAAKAPAKRNRKDPVDGVRLKPDMKRYVVGLGTTAGGRSTVDINDKPAEEMRGATVEEVAEGVAEEFIRVYKASPKAPCVKSLLRLIGAGEGDKLNKTGVAEALLSAYDGLNLGMRRMNLGNRYRALLAEAKASKAE